MGGPRMRDRELLSDRAHERAAWTGVQLLKVIMVMVNSKEQNLDDIHGFESNITDNS